MIIQSKAGHLGPRQTSFRDTYYINRHTQHHTKGINLKILDKAPTRPLRWAKAVRRRYAVFKTEQKSLYIREYENSFAFAIYVFILYVPK